MNETLLDTHLKLLDGNLFSEVVHKQDYIVAKSFLADNVWNQFIPLNNNSILNVVSEFKSLDNKDKSREYSFYLEHDLEEYYSSSIKSENLKKIFVDIYLYKELEEKYEVNLGSNVQFEEVQKDGFDEYLNVAKKAFFDWEDEKEYVTTFFNFGRRKDGREFRNFVLKENKEIISFGSVIYSKGLNIAYMHNSGTARKHRRKGYFSKLKKFMMNFIYDQDIKNVYVLVEEGGGSYHALTKMDFTEKIKYIAYSK